MAGKFTAVCAEKDCNNPLKTQQEIDANWTCIACQLKKITDQELIDMLTGLRNAHNLMSGETPFERREKKLLDFKVTLIIAALKIRGISNP